MSGKFSGIFNLAKKFWGKKYCENVNNLINLSSPYIVHVEKTLLDNQPNKVWHDKMHFSQNVNIA